MPRHIPTWNDASSQGHQEIAATGYADAIANLVVEREPDVMDRVRHLVELLGQTLFAVELMTPEFHERGLLLLGPVLLYENTRAD